MAVVFVILFCVLAGICVAAAYEVLTASSTRGVKITFAIIFSALACLCTILAIAVSITGVK